VLKVCALTASADARFVGIENEELQMADEKGIAAATNAVMSAVERLIIEEGFQPNTVISALINVAVAAAFHASDRTSQEANELIRLDGERALAGMTYGDTDGGERELGYLDLPGGLGSWRGNR
jgi:hypothetical protein